MKLFVFLSELLGRPVFDVEGRRVGRFCDMGLRFSAEAYPRAAGIIVRRGTLHPRFAAVDMESLGEAEDVFRLKVPASRLRFSRERRLYDFILCKDVLDRQVVDVDHRKVVRVNDIHLLRVDTHFYMAHLDVGLRGLVRRLGWGALVDAIVRRFAAHSGYLTRDELIPWKNAQLLTTGRYKNVLRLNVAGQRLAELPPADLAEIMEDLDVFERILLFRSLPPEQQRRVFSDLATQEKEDLIDQMTEREAAVLLEQIPADEATDLLTTLPREEALRLMRWMQTETSKKLRTLLGFAQDSAGGLMTTEYLSVPRQAAVADALRVIRENLQYPGNVYHIYVLDEDGRLLGSASLRQLLNADPRTPILDVCDPHRVFVRTDDDMEKIALLLEKYKFSSIPVLSEDDVLQGVITIDDVMEELISLIWKKYKEKLV